ncbi:hypothetical protein PAV_4c00360 [Paenibacillus alvei DSM 29]|nr:hypothetical protein PAV_4c00360 [Paenibacillus alvei DSM 29]
MTSLGVLFSYQNTQILYFPTTEKYEKIMGNKTKED